MKNNKVEELEKEKKLDQEEIIEFEYYDRINKQKVIIKDKRKIKVALLEMEEYERKQRSDILENECPYDPKTDDRIDESQDPESIIIEREEFEELLEDVLQEMADKIHQNQEERKKIIKFFSEHIFEFTEKQMILIFLRYYLDFSVSTIIDFLHISKQTFSKHIERIEKKFKKLV